MEGGGHMVPPLVSSFDSQTLVLRGLKVLQLLLELFKYQPSDNSNSLPVSPTVISDTFGGVGSSWLTRSLNPGPMLANLLAFH